MTAVSAVRNERARRQAGAAATPRIRVLVVATHLHGREHEAAAGRLPINHLWGVEYLRAAGDEVVIVPARGDDFASRLLRTLTRWTRGRIGDLELELQLFRRLRDGDIVYVVAGVIFWHVLARALGLLRLPIVESRHVPPAAGPTWKLLFLKDARWLAAGYDGFACLTARTAEAFRAAFPRSLAADLEWYADLVTFAPRDVEPAFFFACGRTNRDYETLLRAAARVDFPVRLLVSPVLLSGLEVPANVSCVRGPEDPHTDAGIDYAELVERLYAPALAVLIPRRHDPNDTCGLTNILEALAMGKPIVMTRTGCLDVDVERDGVGLHVEPGDVDGWVTAMRRLLDDPVLVAAMGRRSRALAERRYSIERFGPELRELLLECAARGR
jgi:glycosyltransferase involved in cell wall biosynthesis